MATVPTRSPGDEGVSLRQAALTGGFAYLLNPVSYAEFSILPALIIPGKIEQTAANITAHPGSFAAAIFCYFISALGDIVIAWALYHLLRPVNRSLSLLTAWVQLVYAGLFIVATFNLTTAYRLLQAPEYKTAFEPGALQVQLLLQLNAFYYDWGLSLIVFGIHLVLLGILIFRSRYIPRVLGVVLVVNGLGWMVNGIGPYAFPAIDLDYIQITFLGELAFMLWLLVRGWKLPST